MTGTKHGRPAFRAWHRPGAPPAGTADLGLALAGVDAV